MTGSDDPWRTLGLAPGAPLDEIRRAYRRLAKANHPDAAGEAALPRFLAIQAAYETLAGPGRGRRPGARPGTPPAPTEPWRADPDRARATGRAERRGRPAPGARPGGPTGTDEDRDAAGPAGGHAGARSSDGGAGASGPRAGAGPPNDRSSAGRRPRADEPGPGRRTGGRRRSSNRATPGSTSYDAADEEPFEPGWTGATWYGASSGTYWTINPKEYADPRKHGPEYQARARRAVPGSRSPDNDDGVAPDRAAAGTGADAPAVSAAAPDPESWPGTAEGAAGSATRATDPATDPATERAPRRPAWTSAGRAARAAERTGDRASGRSGPPVSPFADLTGRPADDRPGALLRPPATALGRLGLALLGWPPLGVAVATGIGESTGCGRFAASCGEVFSPGTWIVQIAIILLLLAIPQLAAWSAVGTLAALAAAIPTAVVLSAGGASRQPDASVALLLAVLGLAYVAGVAWAIVRQWWLRPG